MAAIRLLLAEDDENLGSLLREYLQAKSYETDWRTDGEKALDAFMNNDYDIIIIDVMMPLMDGFTLAKEIRKVNADVPFLFLTAKSMKEDVLKGFKIGADDYMTKPFSMEELIFRVEAILRRTQKTADTDKNEFDIGQYHFDANKQLLDHNGNIQKLTTKESELLKLLCVNQNQILERNYALKQIWVDDNYFNARSMDVYITKLRKYLKEDPSIQILNIHGKGFKLIVD